MEELDFSILDSVDKIGKNDWDDLFGDIPESYSFYKTLENSQLRGFSFFYLAVYQKKRVIFIAPLFSADFNIDIAVTGAASKIINFIRKVFPRFLIFKSIFCGSAFGEYSVLGVKKLTGLDGLLPALLKGIEGLAGREGSKFIIFKDFLKEDTLFLDALKNYGFSKIESFPAVSVELGFSSFEEYLKSLGRSTRKSLKKKLKLSSPEIEIKTTQDAKDYLDDIIALYENTYQVGKTRFEHLSRKFFEEASRQMHPHARFFLYFVNKKLAAFNLCFVYKDLLIDKFIGSDYDISKRHNLYFLSWAYNVRWCIDNRLRFYYPGQTDYGPKLNLGGKLIPLFAYAKHRNKALNFMLRMFIPLLKPKQR